MTIRQQLRWGGLWIIIASILMNGTNLLVYSGYHNATIQAIYGIGFTGLILSATVIHIAQAKRAGVLGLLAYLMSILSLAYANVVNFLTQAEFAGIEAANQAFSAIWDPVMRMAVYAIFIGMTLLGISVAVAGVLPRQGGILLALGVALQLPAMYAIDTVGQLFYVFTIGGSILTGVGLIWIGWALWSGQEMTDTEPGLSNLDRVWGGPIVILSALILTVNAFINSFTELTLIDSIVNLLAFTFLIPGMAILYSAQAERAGRLGLFGFLFTHLGATLSVIPAYLIMAQLAGQIHDNRALMASWVDIPVGQYGSYMVLLGIFLFGISVIRANVFPRWTGWLIAIGLAILIPSQFAPQAYLFTNFWVIGAILQGVGFGWMGWTLWSRKPTEQIVQLSESTT